MLPATLQGAFSRLTEALDSQPGLAETLHVRWAAGGAANRSVGALSAALAATIDLLEAELGALTQSTADGAELGQLFGQPAGEILFGWVAASTWRRDVRLAPVLEIALKH